MFTPLIAAASGAGQWEVAGHLLSRVEPDTGRRPFKEHYRCVMEVGGVCVCLCVFVFKVQSLLCVICGWHVCEA
jgi:hypothetical protein